jgi:hypothetical protein
MRGEIVRVPSRLSVPKTMSVGLITADEWCPSTVTEHRLRDLEKEGLLYPLTSLTRPEWIAPPVEH